MKRAAIGLGLALAACGGKGLSHPSGDAGADATSEAGAAQPRARSARCRADDVWTWRGMDAGGPVRRVAGAYYALPVGGSPSGWGKLAADGPEPGMLVPLTEDLALSSVVELSPTRGDRLVTMFRGGTDPATGDYLFETRVLARGETTYAPAVPALAAFYRGTLDLAFEASFDGARGVFGTGHVAVEDPRAIALDPDGKPVGARVDLPFDGHGFGSMGVVPTEHAGAMWALTLAGPKALLFVELDPAGGVAARGSYDLGDAPSNLIVGASSRGVIAVWKVGASFFHARRLPDGLAEQRDLVTNTPGRPTPQLDRVVGFSSMETGLAVLVVLASGTPDVLWLDDAGAVLDELPLPGLNTVAWVPTEAGRLAVRHQPEAEGVALVEIVCR
jgi:hypothetical protein